MLNYSSDNVLSKFVESEFQKLCASSESLEQLTPAKKLFTDYLEWRIHGFEFGSRLVDVLNCYSATDKEVVLKKILSVAKEVIRVGRETGRRYDNTDLITPQELALFQSGRGAEGISPTTTPYMPFAFERFPNIDLERLRTQRGFISWAAHAFYYGFYYGLGSGIVKVTLEPLDNNGNTIRDPRPLDEQMQPILVYTKSDNFPFRRD